MTYQAETTVALSASSEDIAVPAGTAVGDVLALLVSTQGDQPVASSDATERASLLQTGSFSGHIVVWAGTYTVPDPVPATINVSFAGNPNGSATLIRLSGVSETPEAVDTVGSDSGSSLTLPALTATADATLVALHSRNDSGSTVAFGEPTDYTQQATRTGTPRVQHAVATREFAAGGGTGTVYTSVSGSGRMAGIHLSFAPSAGTTIDAPANVDGARAVTLSWDAVTGATEYQPYVNAVAYGTPVTGTSVVVEGVTAGDVLTVTASDGTTESDPSSGYTVPDEGAAETVEFVWRDGVWT